MDGKSSTKKQSIHGRVNKDTDQGKGKRFLDTGRDKQSVGIFQREDRRKDFVIGP